ncbi:hypothetical protein AC481_02465 [miscellaneous Crenarchaeota group archaeon SMTZ-80]|nr:MAG: hypothetical protein AC481_02465 [miscellaneous Crenarchaeota group archaeon SMTZ-80]
MSHPRDKFKLAIDLEAIQSLERIFLNVAIWPGTKDPSADVIRVSVDGLKDDDWKVVGKISIYRDQQGYRELPRQPWPPPQEQDKIESSAEKKNENKKSEDIESSNFSEESEQNPFE